MKIYDGQFDFESVRLDERPVGIFLGEFRFSQHDFKHIRFVCRKILMDVFSKAETQIFTGIVRFDLVVCLTNRGQIQVIGVYEINGHSPECIAAHCALEALFPEFQPSHDPVSEVCAFFHSLYGDRTFALVRGSSRLKEAWGNYYLRSLQDHGLDIREVTASEVSFTPRNTVILRWGDIPFLGVSQFSSEDTMILKTLSLHRTVINTIVPNHFDFTWKRHLLHSETPFLKEIYGENRPLDRESDIEWSLELVDHHPRYRNLVLKPDEGSNGDNIVFGEKVLRQSTWCSLLSSRLGRGYSLFEKRLLPSALIGGREYVFDLNPTFGIHYENGKLEVFHEIGTIFRLTPKERYQKDDYRINVSRGGMFSAMTHSRLSV